MANVSNFAASTDGAKVAGTLTDNQVAQPQMPAGLRTDGCRVTFNFRGLWDSGNDYIYYDVVRDSSGASWICKYPTVPAGTPLVEGTYWAKWSDPNIEFEELQRIVETYDGRITANASAISAETSRAEAAEKENANEITSLKTETQFSNEYIVFIGDSYVQGNADPKGTSVIDPVISILGLKNAHVYGNGGAGFVTKGNRAYPDKNYNDMLNDVISSDLKDIADKVTHVVFVGGWNDTNQNGVQNAVQNTINNARSIFKNAKIINLYVTCGSRANTKLYSHTKICNYYQLGSYTAGAAFSSCRAIPWWMETPSDDGIHPTTNAINWFIGPWIASAITAGGSIDDFLGNKFSDNDLHYLTDQILPESLSINFDLGKQNLLEADWSREIGKDAAYITYVVPAGSNEWKQVILSWGAEGNLTLNNTEGFSGTLTCYKLTVGEVSAIQINN